MRWKVMAGVLMTAAFLIPATSATARTESPAPAPNSCQTFLLTDIRELITIDPETASDDEIEDLAHDILAAAQADSLPFLPGRIEARLGGTAADLRAFLSTGLEPAWSIDLRVAVNQTLASGGPAVLTAGQEALDNGTAGALLAFLNEGRYIARASDSGSLRPYRDLRPLITVDLEAATYTQLRMVAHQLLLAARADALSQLPGKILEALNGTSAQLRQFLRTGFEPVWSADLSGVTDGAYNPGGPHVRAAVLEAFAAGTIDAHLAFLNRELYVARALDCSLR